MRSKAFDAQKDTNVVVLLGDSILSGGNQTDQDSLASSILEQELSTFYAKPIRVLNISAASWSPEEIVGYLNTFGVFNADLFILVTNGNDAFEKEIEQGVVGKHPQYPSKKKTVWENILVRGKAIVSQRFGSLESNQIHSAAFNEGFEKLYQIAEKTKYLYGSTYILRGRK